MGKKIITFYEYMMHYPHQIPDRLALAAAMSRLAPHHEEIKKIDSLMDLMAAGRLLAPGKEADAVSGSLWYEYCAVSGHPMD